MNKSVFFILILVRFTTSFQTKIIPDNYDKAFRPQYREGKPLNISYSIKVNGIQEINLDIMSVKIHLYLRVSWIDDRLIFPQEYANVTNDSISLHTEWLDQIWRPDHFFRLIRKIQDFKLLQMFRGVKMFTNSRILTSSLYEIEVGCPMNFQNFPFDTQMCSIYLGSYFHSVNEVRFSWDKLGLVIDDVVSKQLSDYDFEFQRFNETVCACIGCIPDTTPCIRLMLTLRRYYLLYLLAFYIPSSLFVMVAWTSFFWPAEVIPGRTGLVITALLTIFTLYSTSRSSSPKTSYVKALDAWMFFTIIAGTLALFQYAVVLQWIKKKDRVKDLKIHPMTENENVKDQSITFREKEVARYTKYQKRTELVGIIGLPIFFAVFNLVYWPLFI